MNEIPETLAANVDVVDVATSEMPATSEVTAPTGETITPENVVPTEPQETETQAFARRLKEKVTAERGALSQEFNSEIASLGMEWNGQPITTIEQLRQAKAEQKLQEEAETKNIPVEVLQELQNTKSTAQQALDKLSAYERKEAMLKEAATLSADPKWGDFYKANEAEIRAVAENAGCDLGIAKLIVYDRSGPTKVDEAAIAQKAIQDYISGKQTSYKPVEGSGATPVQVVSKPKSFDEADANVKRIFASQ